MDSSKIQIGTIISILSLSLTVGSSVWSLASQVSRLSSSIDGLTRLVELERTERIQSDNVIHERIDRAFGKPR